MPNPIGINSGGNHTELDPVAVAYSIADTTALASYAGAVRTVIFPDSRTYDRVSSTATADGVLILSVAGSTTERWVLRFNHPLPVTYWGADPTGNTDSTAAITAALNSNAPSIRFPRATGLGYYKVSGQMVIASQVGKTIRFGEAKIQNSDLTKQNFLFQNCTDLRIYDGELGYLTMPTANGGNFQHVAQFDGCQNIRINNIRIDKSGEMGVAFTNCNRVTIRDSYISRTFRDGIYCRYCSNVRIIDNEINNAKDDAISFHDKDDTGNLVASDKDKLRSYGYTQSCNALIEGNTIENCYQGIASISSANVKIRRNSIKNTVNAAIALFNILADTPANADPSIVKNCEIAHNETTNTGFTTTINGTDYPNNGQAGAGRAAIFVGSLGSNKQVNNGEQKRLSGVRVHHNTVNGSGANGFWASMIDVLVLNDITIINCAGPDSSKSLNGIPVEIGGCTKLDLHDNYVLDTRATVLHTNGYQIGACSGYSDRWNVVGFTATEANITSSTLSNEITKRSLVVKSDLGVMVQGDTAASRTKDIVSGEFTTMNPPSGPYAVKPAVTGMPSNGLNWNVTVTHHEDAGTGGGTWWTCVAHCLQTPSLIYTGGRRGDTGWQGWRRIAQPVAYTPTSTADSTGTTGDQAYDANSIYQKTPGGWVGTPLFSLGAFPVASTVVTTKTRAGIQAAVDAARDGDRIGLFGTYDFSGTGPTLTITKNIELVGLQGCTWDAGTTRHDMVLINSISTGITIKNIKMVSMHVGTTGDNGMILCNEVGDINNLLFENLEMTAPVGRYNAISMSAWSEQGNSGCFFRNLTFRNLYIHDMGRMGGELLAHKGDGVPRIIGVLVDKCTVKSVGLYNPANSDDVNGMGWSFSGEITNVMMIAPQVHDTLLGLEFVGTRIYQVVDPIITGSRSRTDSKGTLINAVGISITDGGQTDRGKSNLRPNQGVITGGRINVTGRPLNTRYADDVLFEVGNWNGGEYVQLQFGNGLKFRRQSIESSAAQFIIYFQQQTNLTITACKWSRETAAINGVHPLYEPVSFDGGCSGTINGLDIRTIGSPDNVGDGNNRNYLVSNSTPVKWQNLWWNGQRIADNQ